MATLLVTMSLGQAPSTNRSTPAVSADIHTRGFVDEGTFGALKQLINILTPEQIKNGDFKPWFAGEEELPEYARGWLNSH